MDGESKALEVRLGGDGSLAVYRAPQTLWDPDAFLQTERVANIMTDSGLMPKALTHYKEGQGQNATELPFDRSVVFARAVLIATQARALEVDPVLFAQCCAIVHGRLMYEGKLVHAMIEKRLGVNLRYDFGLWNTDHFEPVADETQLYGQGERLSVRVVGQLNGEDFERTVEGSVGVWKTAQWGAQATWRQRLRYRGAREWARAHTPGIILGIVTTDEADELEVAAERAALLVAPSHVASAMHAGFEDPNVDPPAAEPEGGRRRRRRAPETPAAAEIPPATNEILEGDDLPDNLKADPTDGAPANTATASAPDAGIEPDTSETATAASGDGQAETSESSARPLEAGPEPDEEEEEGEEGADEEEEGDEEGSEELDRYIAEVENAESWGAVKKAMQWFFVTPMWTGFNTGEQAVFRAKTWEFASKLSDVEDHAQSPTAFRLWLESVEDPDAIKGTLAVLEKGAAFLKMPPSQQDGIRRAVAGRIERLQE